MYSISYKLCLGIDYFHIIIFNFETTIFRLSSSCSFIKNFIFHGNLRIINIDLSHYVFLLPDNNVLHNPLHGAEKLSLQAHHY